jgi:hypothetical protein
MRVGDKEAPSLCGIAFHQCIAQISARDSNIGRFGRTSATVKQLCGPDAIGRGRMKQCEWNEGSFCRFRPPIAIFYQETGQCQCLSRAFETACGPLGPEDISWWKIPLLADSALAHTARTTQQLLAEFWTLADRLPKSLDFTSGNSLSGVLQAKVRSGEIHPQDLTRIPPLPGGSHGKKWHLHRIDEQPTAHWTPTIYFQGYHTFQ